MKKITVVALVASIIGLLVSVYLVIVKYSPALLYCTPGLGDCQGVQNSRWSTMWGIPIALFGALAYLTLIGCYLFENLNRFTKKYAFYVIFGVSIFGFLYSLFLTWLELFVIHAVCQWCLISAVCMTLIFITTVVQLKHYQYRTK